MSDGTWKTAVMDPAEVCRLIRDMRDQVEGVSSTLETLRTGLTELEARVMAMPLPFAEPVGAPALDTVAGTVDTARPDALTNTGFSSEHYEPEAPYGESHLDDASLPEAPPAEEQTAETQAQDSTEPADAFVSGYPYWGHPARESDASEPESGTGSPDAAQTEAAAVAENEQPWREEMKTPAVDAPSAQLPTWPTSTSWQEPEAGVTEEQTGGAAVGAVSMEPTAPSGDETAESAVEAQPDASPEPSWLAAGAALDSIWSPRETPEGEQTASEPAASAAPEEPRKPSLTGWPDESIWSPSYDWKPAAQREAGAEATAQPEPVAEEPSAAEPSLPAGTTSERRIDNSWLTSSSDASSWSGFGSLKAEQPESAAYSGDLPGDARPEMTDESITPAAGLDQANQLSVSGGLSAAMDADATRRAEVTEAVARMRAELGYGAVSAHPSPAAEPVGALDEEARRREEVANAVARLREELESAGAADAEDATDTLDQTSSAVAPAPEQAGDAADEDAVREEVRRTVEAARAELAGARPAAPPRPAPSGNTRFTLSDWTVEQERDGPPVIVIKDSEGRVELAHVYEALNRVSCGDSAALLNYTPHSVTIGLPVRAVVPGDENLASAFESVFGRPCKVQSDGVRISVSMGGEPGRNEEAA